MAATSRTVGGLIIEREDALLTLREPALGRNTIITFCFVLVGIGFVVLGIVAAQGFGLFMAVVVGAALASVGGAALLGHARGDGILRVDLDTGAMTRGRATVTPGAGERPELFVVREHRHRTDPNGVTTTAVSWWHAELVVGDERWRLHPAHRNRATVDLMAQAVREHLGGSVGYRDDAGAA